MRLHILALFLLGCGTSSPSASPGPGPGACTGADVDLDGFSDCDDCDDADPTVHPAATDFCDGVDNDCSGTADRDLDGVGICRSEQVGTPAADFLFVVDNSGSMGEEQTGLFQASEPFIAALRPELDYHVGAVSTDMSDATHMGKLRQAGGVRWVEPDTPNPAQILSSMIELGTSGAPSTQHRDALYSALEVHTTPGGYNEGFLREDATLDIVVISDGLDESTMITATDIEDYLVTMKADPGLLRVHAIVSETNVCPTATGAETTWLDLRDLTGGLFHSVCTSDWTATLEAIAGIGGPQQEFVLPEAAAADSLFAVVAETPYPPFTEYGAADLELLADGVTVLLPEPAPYDATITVFYAPL